MEVYMKIFRSIIQQTKQKLKRKWETSTFRVSKSIEREDKNFNRMIPGHYVVVDNKLKIVLCEICQNSRAQIRIFS